jgi:hypothetical protein
VPFSNATGSATRDPVGLCHVVSGVDHLQRLGDVLGHEPVERLARHNLDDAGQHIRRLAVIPIRTGLVGERQGRDLVDLLGQRLWFATGPLLVAFIGRSRLPDLSLSDFT